MDLTDWIVLLVIALMAIAFFAAARTVAARPPNAPAICAARAC